MRALTLIAALLLAQKPPSKDVAPGKHTSTLSAPSKDHPPRAVAGVLDLTHSTLPALGQAGAFFDCAPEADAGCGSGYAWACYTASGTKGTVQNKCANGAELGPFVDSAGARQYVMSDITDATAPYIAAADAAALGLDQLWLGAWTVVAVARPTSKTSTNPFLLAHGAFNATGVEMYGFASFVALRVNQAGASQPASVNVTPLERWSTSSITYTGASGVASNLAARINGNVGSAGTATDPVAPTDRHLYFGRGNTSGGPIRGPLARVLIYDRQLSSAELATIEAQVNGMVGRVANASVDSNGTRYVLGDDGQYRAMGQDMTVAQADGIDVWESVTNYWTHSLDASAWADVGTPTIGTNAASGPFALYNLGAEADSITDDDGAALEGKESASAGTATGTYTVSCYLASSTATTYTLSVVTDGTGGGSCTGTGLTSSFTRATCTPTAVSGTPSYVKARVLVGDSVDDTGAIYVSDCELTKTTYAQRPCLAGGTAATCPADVVSVSTSGWPTSHGRIVLKYTPAVADGFAVTRRLVTARSGASGWSIDIEASTGKLVLYTGNAGANTSKTSDALTWTAGQEYEVDVRFGLDGVVSFFRDGVAVGTATGAAIVDVIGVTAYLGSTGSASFANGRIRLLKVTR